MAIKNLFGRGVGFGGVHWIVTHGYDSSSTPPVVSSPSKKLPTRLSFELVTSQLATPDYLTSQLTFVDENGSPMSIPLKFSRTETGPITLLLDFIDGSVEDLSTASAITLTIANQAGTKIVDAVALTSGTALGTCIWTRTTGQVATAGDYQAQAKVTRANTTIGLFPDGQTGIPVTILPIVGD